MNNDLGHSPELHRIAEKYLAAVRRGVPLVDCLADCRARYGDAVLTEVQPALEAALLVSRLRQPAMRAASVDALELRLRGAMLARRRAPALTGLARLAAAVAVVMLALLGTGGGAVAASENAVPGEALYPIKRLWEEIVLALSPLTGERDAIWLWIAQRRLAEAETLAARGQLTPQALADLLAAMEQAVALATPARQPALRAYLNDVRAALAPVLPPPGAEVTYERVLRRVAPLPDTPLPVPSAVLTAEPTLASSPTASPTLTPTSSPTASPTLTLTASATASPTATSTPTSRVPATATATPLPPSPTPTVPPPSPTPSLTPSPTHTWTPLPLPVSPVFTPPAVPTATSLPTELLPTAPPTNTPWPWATERWRETQAAVYMTQTAQARMLTTETP